MNFELFALILSTGNRQIKGIQRISMAECSYLYRCELFVLICIQGAWRCPGWRSATNGSTFFMIHIGEIIRRELDRQERTPAWLARKINCERPNVYYIFRQKSINTDMLLRISNALNHNFFQYYISEIEN